MKIIVDNNWSNVTFDSKDYSINRSIPKEIKEYFSVEVPNSYFIRRYRPNWDGMKHYFTPKGNIRTGLLPFLLEFIESNYPDIDIKFEDIRGNIPSFKENPINKFGKYVMDGQYEYQFELIKKYNNYLTYKNEKLYFPRGIINAATNAGKMIITAGIYFNFEGNNHMLILIDNKLLHQQLYEFYSELLGSVGIISAETIDIKNITIAMVKSFYNRINEGILTKEQLNLFNILVVDECHLAGAKTYEAIINKLNSPVRVFLSGTALDSESVITRLNIISLSGKVMASINKVDLMKSNVSKKIKVFINYFKPTLDKPLLSYDDYYNDCIVFSRERAALISSIISNYKDKMILIAVEQIYHGEYLEGYLNNVLKFIGYDFKVKFTHANDPNKKQIIEDFKNKKINVLISTRIMKLGINIADIAVIIYALGGKSIINVKQWMGRGERKSSSEEELHFYDFYDDVKYLKTHSKKRIKMYKKEKLEVIFNFNIDEL